MNRKHFKCLLWKTLWSAGILSLIVAWFALKSGAAFGLDIQVWFWNSLIFVALSIPIKLDCHSCDVCGINPRT